MAKSGGIFSILIAAALTIATGGFAAGTFAFGAATTVGGWFGMGATFGAFLIRAGLGLVMNALTPSAAQGAGGYNVTQKGSALEHQIIYGRVRAGGVVVFDRTTGGSNKYLHRVLAFTGHEIDSFEEIYINGLRVETLQGNGNVLSVIDESGNSSDRYDGFVTIVKKFGTVTQTAVTMTDVPEWTNDHKLSGIAYLYVKLKYNQNKFPNGVPDITSIIKGKKVYDPSNSTTAWSDNPALIIRDYLTSSYGLNELAANIDDDLVIAARTACNRTSDNGDTWFTCNGNFTTSATPYTLLKDLLTSMGGLLWYSQGKWRMRAAVWSAPTMTVDENDLRSSISIGTRHSRRDNFNTVRGTWRGDESDWQVTDFPEVITTDNEAVATDGGQVSAIDLKLPFTDNPKEAQRIARIMLERNRQQLTISGQFGLRAMALQVGDIVNVTNYRLGFDVKPFEVVEWTFGIGVDNDITVQMTLREISQDVFDEIDNYSLYEKDNTTLASPFSVQTVSVDTPVKSTVIVKDGTALSELTFTWSVVDTSDVDYYIFSYRKSTDTFYNSVQLKDQLYRISPAISGMTYTYAVQAMNHLGVSSTFTTATVTTLDDQGAPSIPTSFTAVGGYQDVKLNWVNPTDLDFSHVVVTRLNENGIGYVVIGEVSGTSFVDGGRSNETQYTYRLSAKDYSNNQSGNTTNQSATTLAEIQGPVGAEGPRGAGRWDITVTTLPNTSVLAGEAFVLAIGSPVNSDQAWFRNAANEQAVWIYDSGTATWNEQTEVVDGNLLVTGSIEAGKLNVSDLSAISANLGTIEVDSAHIANAAVETLKIGANAVTVPAFANVITTYNIAKATTSAFDFPVQVTITRTGLPTVQPALFTVNFIATAFTSWSGGLTGGGTGTQTANARIDFQLLLKRRNISTLAINTVAVFDIVTVSGLHKGTYVFNHMDTSSTEGTFEYYVSLGGFNVYSGATHLIIVEQSITYLEVRR